MGHPRNYCVTKQFVYRFTAGVIILWQQDQLLCDTPFHAACFVGEAGSMFQFVRWLYDQLPGLGVQDLATMETTLLSV